MSGCFAILFICVGVTGLHAAEKEQELGTIAFPSLAPRGWDLYIHENGEERLLVGDDEIEFNAAFSPEGESIAYVKSVRGNLDIFIRSRESKTSRRLTSDPAMEDHPSWSPTGEQLAFVSTRQPNEPGRAWTGIYTIRHDGREWKRISPDGASDYSPAWSPAGDWIAFASGSGAPGETDIFLMKPDGTERHRLCGNGGWPAFAEAGNAVLFHRQNKDREWEIWRIGIDGSGPELVVSDAAMPSTTPDGKRLAYVKHPASKRQIAILNLESGRNETEIDSSTALWNPTISADGSAVVYHRVSPNYEEPNVQLWEHVSDLPVTLLRVAGGFPVFSPDRQWVAVTAGNFSKIDMMRPDGSDRRTIFEGSSRSLFGLSWFSNPSRLAFSHGIAFGPATADVKLTTINPDDLDAEPEIILERAGNSGFPNASPDGNEIVFRAESEGAKNLFIANRESGAVRQLTKGNWTDTMPHWSPTGDWIAFSSTRDNDFEIWLIRPDGSDIHKLIGDGGRNTHPQFSPDGRWVVFASQRAGYSAEVVSLPRMPQAYGDLFAIKLDGTGLTRLTHNPFEEGTPAWTGLKTVLPTETPFTGRGEF